MKFLAFSCLSLSTSLFKVTASAQSIPNNISQVCEQSYESFGAAVEGIWQGIQFKYNTSGELQRTLKSEFTVERKLRNDKSEEFALVVNAKYTTVENVEFSNNSFQLGCDTGTGKWSQTVPEFGTVTLTPIGIFAAIHQVESQSTTGTLRSISMWDLSKSNAWTLTTHWYANEMPSGFSTNQMNKVTNSGK